MSQCDGDNCQHSSHFDKDGNRIPKKSLIPEEIILDQNEKWLKMTNPKKWWREYGSKK